MRSWRLVVLAALVAAPILVLIGFGVYHLWLTGLAFWLWWPLMGLVALAYFLGWRWQKAQKLLRVDFSAPLHWTERDRQAWRLVEARAQQVPQGLGDRLTSVLFYLETAEAIAFELARFYHPGAKDPLGSLTIPEILAVVELAAHDLAGMVNESLPGGHLFTINDLRKVKQIADWYPTARNLSWLVSSIFSPLNTAVRYLAVESGMSRPWQLLQENVLVWFYTAFVHRLGAYLVDLNSGRLRVGAQRYLALQKEMNGVMGSEPADAVRTVTFALVGQAKAGKSSLINALLGERKAQTDVLPLTANVERYELRPAGIPSRFKLLDTVGYANEGPRGDRKKATEEAARQADIVLLVVHARNPARQADLDMLLGLREYFEKHSDLHKPPVLAVLTHIDLLTPAMEWSPPYDWQHPKRLKESQIQQAVAAVREQLGDRLAGVVPVCTAPGKAYGVVEWLLPILVSLLDQAHAVAFLRCLKAEADAGKVRKVFHQLISASKGLAGILLKSPSGAVPR
jgi:predicted GTPase